jgi:hypothetical protein
VGGEVFRNGARRIDQISIPFPLILYPAGPGFLLSDD